MYAPCYAGTRKNQPSVLNVNPQSPRDMCTLPSPTACLTERVDKGLYDHHFNTLLYGFASVIVNITILAFRITLQ